MTSTRIADEELVRYINLKLAVLGQPTNRATTNPKALEFAGNRF